MDRVIVYPGALPQTVDQLSTNKFGMVGQAYQNSAILGTSTVIAGLACTPTSPTPDLHVTVGVGSIYQLDPPDQSAYGDLGTDTAVSIMKQGILNSPAVLSITPPGTAGFSQVFLVQAILNDVDGGQMVLSYYNSANPAAPFAGPANSGTSNFTVRGCPCVIALKAGTAATTGTQTTPAPDAGYVGLYAVTVANGQTQITSGNIIALATIPTFPTLPSVPGHVQKGDWIYCVDTGALNALIITPVPQITALVAGMGFRVKVLVTNTLASTISVVGSSTFGPITIHRGSGAGVAAGDLTSGTIVDLVYDGTFFQMINYMGSGTNTNTNTLSNIPYIADSGAVNALVGTYSPAITGGQQVAGLFISIKLANTITGACTINVNGLGIKSVKLGDLTDPPYNLFTVNQILLLVYDGTQYQIVSGANQAMIRKAPSNLTLYVNGSIGNDANDGVSNTSGHALLTIQGGLNKAFTYAPGQFTVTIFVEPGTYNEFPVSPNWAGPTIVIDGGSSASVTINAGAHNCLTLQGPNNYTVQNITWQNNGAYPFAGLVGSGPCVIVANNTASNAVGHGVFNAGYGATILTSNHTYSGSTYSLWYPGGAGSNILLSGNHTFSTPINVTFASAYCIGGNCSTSNVTPATFVNAGFVSGSKFTVALNGTAGNSGTGINYFPGTIAGTSQSGGQYAT